MSAQSFFSMALSFAAFDLNLPWRKEPERSFTIFCKFVFWCLTDAQWGAMRAVRTDSLREAMSRVADLCRDEVQDTDAWRAAREGLVPHAMRAGRAEGRAADTACAFARTVGDVDPEYAGVAVRNLLKIADRDAVAARLTELVNG